MTLSDLTELAELLSLRSIVSALIPSATSILFLRLCVIRALFSYALSMLDYDWVATTFWVL